MEIADVLTALEELKNGIAAVKSANENVEKAATAARKVCEAFSKCSSKIDAFPKVVFEPINGKVAEIAEATAQMVKSCTESVEGLRAETKSIAGAFSVTVGNSCNRIQEDISEFHRELDSFDSKLQRLTNRVEAKTDGVVEEIRKLAGGTHDDLQLLQNSQTEASGRMNAAVKESRIALKADIDSATQGLNATITKEGSRLSGNVFSARDDVLSAVISTKKVALISVIIAFVSAVSAIFLVVRSFGR